VSSAGKTFKLATLSTQSRCTDIGIGLEGMVIRWQAVLKSDKVEDAGRRLFISLSLADDTISVFKPPQK
jgi:hypothetical protein